MYADDLVLISPSSAGLSQLLRECEKFGTRHDVKYNAKKSAVMIYRSMTLKGCTISNFKLNGMQGAKYTPAGGILPCYRCHLP